MDYTKYYEARDKIVDIMRDDLIGPVYENEKINESPVNYYLLGKLYPSNILHIDEEEQQITENDVILEEENAVSMVNETYQSAMGFSFSVDSGVKTFEVEVSAASYVRDDDKMWNREVHSKEFIIDVNEIENKHEKELTVYEQLCLLIQYHRRSYSDNKLFTVTIINRSVSKGFSYLQLSHNTFFQPILKVQKLTGGNFVPVNMEKNLCEDMMELLYHDNHMYATGHGCAVNSIVGKNGVEAIELQVMPQIELNQMRPADIDCGSLFSMKFLSSASYGDVKKEIIKLCNQYEVWIDKQKKQMQLLPISFKYQAEENVEQCLVTLKCFYNAIEMLNEPTVFKAFSYANRTMLLQSIHTKPGSTENSVKWYPFQLAFFLKEIESIVNPKSIDRERVDLLWFPTGGGKTESYLGIAAFTIFYRRLLDKDDIGVSVIMRYTLRLLSLQQFERASAMICAAEVVRSEAGIGGRPFGIGLWAGQSLTPNKLIDASGYLKGNTKDRTNPVQIKKCPWCGSIISDTDYHVDLGKKRMVISCPNNKCDYHNGLPIYLIDEEIYEYLPSFIVGTIDKFAQVAFVEQASRLLGVGITHGVDLIIQDELHLISGPIGTIDGAYEAAFLKLMEKNGVQPKIIASTATIKNAERQISSLYGRNYSQFPPQGIDISDSFFACLAEKNEKANRMYLGIMSPGTSRATAYNRVVASLLFATRYLKDVGYPEEIIDSFWTQTDYFNNLRELGSALTRIIDSVQDRFSYLESTKFAEKYSISEKNKIYNLTHELTSRNNRDDIGEVIQNQLKIPYTSDGSTRPYDFIVASNMISVGIDISRLNTMVVIGQPIKTSEYIQATSRIGRNTPGLVATVFSPAKSRDRSFYEQFYQFHSTLYKYVESMSLTPFADRARDRTLQALYILLCRYTVDELYSNDSASKYRRDIRGLEKVRKYIVDYVNKVDSDELDCILDEIDEIEYMWENTAISNHELVYNDYSDRNNSLFVEDYVEDSRFRMMGSMRNVEPEFEVYTEE